MAKEIQLKSGSDNAYPHPFWPIGAIYISVVNENPSKYFGGTWQSFGSGRCLVGVDTSQTEFNSVQKTGGAKTVALTISQMPSHDHGGKTSTGGDHLHNIGGRDKYNLSGNGAAALGYGSSVSTLNYKTSTEGDHTHSVYAEGDGQAHSNLQPYITVYMWRRTA